MSHNMLLSLKISAVAQHTSEMMGINTETHNGQRAESGKLGSTLSCMGGLYQSLRDLPGHHVSSMWLTGILSNITAINYGGSASRQRPSKSSPPFLPRAFSPPNSSYATYFLIATVDKHPRVHIQTPHTLAPIFSAPLFFFITPLILPPAAGPSRTLSLECKGPEILYTALVETATHNYFFINTWEINPPTF